MIKLVSHTPNPVHNVARGARLCTTDADLAIVEMRLTDEYAERLVAKLAEMEGVDGREVAVWIRSYRSAQS